MNSGQKGNLILKAAPNEKVEQKVVSYLSKLLKNASPELLSAKIRKAPIVISKDVPAGQGKKIAAALKRVGASAAFVPHAAERPHTTQTIESKPPDPSMSGMPKPTPGPSTAASPKSKQDRRKRIIRVFAVILAAFT